ncbi:hypothetical protein AGMMS49525_14870 [Bacteroidia bacterium]|nr:hypothetical protein AGMMS49525_14870 [Bacteroidia bacterium]
MKQYILALIGGFLAVSAAVHAQETPVLQPDAVFMEQDSLFVDMGDKMTFEDSFKPVPTKSVIYSAIFPGLGQIYNRKYWKLPIVYGGFLGCMYAITWNNTQKVSYSDAYRDFMNGNTANDAAWRAYKYYSYDDDPSKWSDQQRSSFAYALRSKKDFFRRNYELSWIITAGLYGLCMIDAYVDAKLFDFDVSDNISMRVQPTFFERTAYNPRTLGVHLSVNF